VNLTNVLFRSLSRTLLGRGTMYSSVFEQAVLLIGAGAACLAARFAILSYFRSHQPTDFLTATGAAQLLRSETEIVRASIDDHGRGLRQELGQSFGILRESIDSQVRGLRRSQPSSPSTWSKCEPRQIPVVRTCGAQSSKSLSRTLRNNPTALRF
jgi:hypothetical protein